MRVRLKEGNILEIKFKYDPDLVDKMRTLEGYRTFKKAIQAWECAPLKGNILKLNEWGFDVDEEVQMMLVPKPQAEIPALEVKGLKKDLFHFQKQGVAYIEEKKGRALVGDDMGLGKTIQATAWLQHRFEVRPAIIVCPASVKLNWRNEIAAWMTSNNKTHVIEGTKRRKLPKSDIYIVNFDILHCHIKRLRKLKPKAIVVDEGHKIKNSKAQRTKAVKALSEGIPHIIILTVTPIENRPIELYNALSLISPSLFPSFFQFARRYCNAQYNGFGWNYNGASNKEELHEILTKHCMIRRLKKDVLKDLPAKIRSVIPIEINNRKEYEKAETDFRAWLREYRGKRGSSANILVQIEYLKQICIEGKLRQIMRWTEDYLEQEEKFVLMGIHRKTIRALRRHFRQKDIRCVRYVGGMSAEEKERTVRKFQEKKRVRLFLGNIQAAGVGITLTAASGLGIMEFGWNRSELDQAEDRIHRIGQKECCNIYYFVAENTIEEKIFKLIDEKAEVITAIIDGKKANKKDILSKLLEQYYKKGEKR